MTSSRRAVLAGLAALPMAAAAPARTEGEPDAFELPITGMTRLSPTLWIGGLAPGLWITCFTARLGGLGYMPANGMIVTGSEGATIVDTGWNPEHGALLLKAAKDICGSAPVRAIATHYHSDRTGGIAAMRAANVPVFAHPFTVGLARAYGAPEPEPVKALEKRPVPLGPVELFFPGPAHSRDNITVWHAPSRTLFGGCLIKSVAARDLGNLDDADLPRYAESARAVAQRYPERRHTVPGHGGIAGDSLGWTIWLAQARG